MLKEMSRDGRNSNTRKILTKLEIPLTIRQCYVMHLIVVGGEIETDMSPVKHELRNRGLAYNIPCPLNTRAANGKIRILYHLTSDGELAYETMKEKFMTVINKINAKRKEAV